MTRPRCLIVGGGLAAWALADALIQQGCAPAELLLVEQRTPGAGSSGVPLAMLQPFTGRSLALKPGYHEAFEASLGWLAALQAQADLPLYRLLPLWRVALDPASAERMARSYQRSCEALAEVDTSLSHPLRPLADTLPLQQVLAAWQMPQSAQVALPRVLAVLQQRCRGVQHRFYRRIRGLAWTGQHWVLASDQERFDIPQLVLAPGSGLAALLPELPLSLSRGEVALFRTPCELPASVSGAGQYAAPVPFALSAMASPPGAHLHVGGATFYRSAHAGLLPQAWSQIRSRLHWFPGVDTAEPVQIWSGVRAEIRGDREPLVGPVPELPGLFVCSAFATKGLLQVPSAVARLASQILENPRAAASLPSEEPGRLPLALWRAVAERVRL
ncbi:MAG: NAD(P)/FAD-dependent oxidoreductase [Candidatus Sericytochromatia bacterium]